MNEGEMCNLIETFKYLDTCILYELNMVFSLFLIIYSVGKSHLCSWHSSADGRLLKKNKQI